MGRTMTAAAKTASKADGYSPPVHLVEMDFDAATTYVTTAPFDIVWNSNTYIGVGSMGAVSSIVETSRLQANGVELTLSGVDAANISLALNQDYVGREVRIYSAILDPAGVVVADPVEVWRGFMDTMPIALGDTSTVGLTCESHWIRWDKPNLRLYNHEQQQARYPNDTGFMFVSELVDKEIVWGRG